MEVKQNKLTEQGDEITAFNISDAYLTISAGEMNISSKTINTSSIYLKNVTLSVRPDSISIIGDNDQVLYYTNIKKDITIINN